MIDFSVCKKWTEKPPSRAKQRFFELIQQIDPSARREVQFHWLFCPKLAERSKREAVLADRLIEHCRRTRDRNRVKALAVPDQLFVDKRCKGRARTLEFDFVLPQVGVAIEFDEKQHFTDERKATFELYEPDEFAFTEMWIDLCSERIRDPDKKNPARDWQRAFKDAVRDFRSRENGIPLVRIYYKEFQKDRLNEPDVLDRLEAEIAKAKALI